MGAACSHGRVFARAVVLCLQLVRPPIHRYLPLSSHVADLASGARVQ
jgi:hypothetical protein